MDLAKLGIPQENEQAFSLFLPYYIGKTLDVINTKRRFVHYTSAEVAMSILRRREIWMRRSSTMNDFQEIEYGMKCLTNAWGGAVGQTFKDLVDDLFAGASNKVTRLFDGWVPHFRSRTYLTCLSEHCESEDAIGRLSMWRAYGGHAGVAIVLNNRPFTSPSDALGAYTSPVAYRTVTEFESELAQLVNGLIRNRDSIRQMDEEKLIAFMFHALRAAVLCTKHPGFREEREWRIIYSPSENPSRRLKSEIRSVRGIPQSIYLIPLQDVPEENLIGIEPSQLIERIIIGPSQHPHVMADAFVSLLKEAGVADAREKVFVSDIPLRL